MKQKKMANIIGVSPALITDIKKGRKTVSRKLALRLHELTGIGLDLLLTLPPAEVIEAVREKLENDLVG